MAFPFTLLIFTAIRSAWMGRRTSGILRFFLAWSIPPALFFSCFPYRTSLYLFILVPALAVLVDWGCFRANRTRTFTILTRATGIAMAIGLALLAFALYRIELVPLWLVLAFVFTGVAAAFVLWFGYMRVFTITALFAVLFFRIASAEIMKADHRGLAALMGRPAPYRGAMLDENRDVWHEVGLLSVSLASPMKRLSGYDDVVEHLEDDGILILSDEQTEKYRLTLDHAFEEKGERLEWRPWKRFKRRGKLPFRAILLDGKAAVPELDAMVSREYSVVRKVATP
jgi:hypothetical protein